MVVLVWVLMLLAENDRGLVTAENILELCDGCCVLPKIFKNGRIYPQFDPSTLIVPKHTVLSFRCRPNYILKGKKINICINGKWLPKQPICISKSCQPPPPVEHGEAILQSHSGYFPAGSRVKYQCDIGYELIQGDELVCTRKDPSLIWLGKRPICTDLKRCHDPGVSLNGYREGDCCTNGNILRYGCNPGFTLIGEETIVCSSETWSNPRPLCRPNNFCPEPPKISHGRVVGNKDGDFYQSDDQISIECERGYTVNEGSDILFCENGQWDDEFPQCTEIKCNLPKIPENGFIHEKNQSIFPSDFEVNFGCQEGFLLVGNSWSACSELGWSHPSPSCRKIRCPIPPVPEGGWKTGDSYEIGDIVEFGCFSGYQLLGSSRRECLPNGKWNGELTRCDSEENDCPNPGIPINGMKIGRFYKFGNIIKFQCQPGKQLIGSQQRICQRNGEWSGEEVVCLDIQDFDQKESVSTRLQEIINAEKTEQEDNIKIYKEIKDKVLANSSHVLSRAINLNTPDRLIFYFIFDTSGSIGSEDFHKSINFVKLLVKKIGVSTDGSRVGVITFSHIAVMRLLPAVYATTENVIGALEDIQFEKGGGTATRLALKLLKEEMIPLTEETLKGKQKPIIFLLTDGKANMEGDPMADAKQLKDYGAEIYCIGITGDRNMKTLYNIATTTNEHVFILDSYDTIDWLVQEIINGSVDYSINCGIQKTVVEKNEDIDDLGRVVGGSIAKRPWPWMAALYFADATDEDISKARHRCGGSVLDKNWILTAAHCFYDQNGIKIDKDNIIVHLGLLNVKHHINRQTFAINKYIIHPGYIREKHHNDIALVKLSREALFNVFVRPICLPAPYSNLPKETKFYREGERAIAIGWGYDKSVKYGDQPGNPIGQLKRVSLPLQNSITCRNSLNNNYEFTDSMFCAGKGDGKEDTCKGDSGGPLMQPSVNDLGQKYWTQVGIISWGVGCAQKGKYGFYTHVARLKEWIDLTRQND